MTGSRFLARAAGVLLGVTLQAPVLRAQGPDDDGKVLSFSRITSLSAGFSGVLAPGDRFGDAVAAVGDLDGNGVLDVAVGAPGSDDGGPERGAVWILLLDPSGSVVGDQKISATAGGFGGGLADGEQFGTAVAAAGDLDGDGRQELVVGTLGERLFVLFLDAAGSVLATQEIAAGTGGFGGALSPLDRFGAAVAGLGDVDGDGVGDLAVGAFGDDDGGNGRGAVWVLFLNADGTVLLEQKISSSAGGFGAGLSNGDAFGAAVAGLGDVDDDGVADLAVGAPLTDGIDFVVPGPGQPPIPQAAPNEGACFVVFLNADGTVASKVEIGQGLNGFDGMPMAGYQFGLELDGMGDVDGNGVCDLLVGVPNHTILTGTVGGFYEVFLAADGTVVKERLVTDKLSGFRAGLLQSLLFDGDRFASPAWVADLNGDCLGDVVVGAAGDDVAGTDAGSIWVLRLDGEPQADTTFRNGSGTNPAAASATNRPRLGRSWVVEVDVSGHPGATISILFAQDQPDQVPSPFGEILVLLTGETQFVDTAFPVGSVATHALAVPLDPSLLGYEAFSQALIGGGSGPELANAIDLKVGY